MSGFPVPITSGQKTLLRGDYYWHRTFIACAPGDVVFQCESGEDIFDEPFKEFGWTNTLQGAYTDVWAGMLVYISSTATAPTKNFKYRGRVRLAPSATVFNIDLNATTLEAGDIITITRDADIFARVREDTLVDGSIAWHDLPPVFEGLPSVLVLYDSDADNSVTHTPSQSGIAVASGKTIASYAWAISGDGANSISNAAIQHPLLTFEPGYMYLVRCTVTDSGGVSNYQFMKVYAITKTFGSPVLAIAAGGGIDDNLDNGFSGNIIAYGGVASLPYRTDTVVFAVEHFSDNSSTPIVTNILMHGRLRSEDITTEGSAEVGRDMQVTYPIEGITSYMQRLKVPNDIVRHAASPNEWGEMVNPTPFRMAVYALYAYTTLLNLVSFSAGDALFDAWRRGGEPVSIDGGFASDTLNTLLGFVDAAPNYAPDGEIRCEINASYKVDRSALVTVMDFLPTDARSFTLNIDTSRQTAQVVGYGGVWNTVNNTFVLYTAQSPSIIYGDAPETREYNRVLLKYNLTTAAAITEIEARTGNDFAASNPKWLLSTIMRDAHRWLVATGYQRYTWTLTATENLREIVITTDTLWQCQSVSITINTDGTYEVSAEFVQETEFADAQSIASQLPDNLPQLNPVTPILSDYPADPDSSLWAMPTDTPADAELQPIDPYSGYLAYSPFTPDQAAAAAKKQGTAKCKTFQVLARNSGTTNSPFLTVNLAAYTLKISGDAQIRTGWFYTLNSTTDPAWVVVTHGTHSGKTFVSAFRNDGFGDYYSIVIDITFPTLQDLTGFSLRQSDPASVVVGAVVVNRYVNYEDALHGLLQSVALPVTDGAWSIADSTAISGVKYVQIVYQFKTPPATPSTLTDVTISGSSAANPFTGDAAGNVRADYYYYYPAEGDAAAAQLFGATEGGLLDGAKPAVIPDYSPDHVYTVPFTGTGNALAAAFALASYTAVQNKAFTIQACRD